MRVEWIFISECALLVYESRRPNVLANWLLSPVDHVTKTNRIYCGMYNHQITII